MAKLGLIHTFCCRMSSAQGIMLGQTRTGSFLALQLSTCHCMPACWSRTALCSRRLALQLQPRAHACPLAARYIKVRSFTVRLFAMASSSDLDVLLHACIAEATPACASSAMTSSAKQP